MQESCKIEKFIYLSEIRHVTFFVVLTLCTSSCIPDLILYFIPPPIHLLPYCSYSCNLSAFVPCFPPMLPPCDLHNYWPPFCCHLRSLPNTTGFISESVKIWSRHIMAKMFRIWFYETFHNMSILKLTLRHCLHDVWKKYWSTMFILLWTISQGVTNLSQQE